MQVQFGVVDGAATQIVVIFTALAYMPGIGLALAGTTLVGQAIGAGDRDWAATLGNRIILIVACYMGGIGLVIALVGDWLVPLFVNDADPRAAEVIALCSPLLWLAAAYQFFDGVNFASAFCLRGAGDARVPALIVLACGVLLFLPLTHMLTFAPGDGWFDGLPGYGLGAIGGWSAILVYVVAIGTALWLRWRRMPGVSSDSKRVAGEHVPFSRRPTGGWRASESGRRPERASQPGRRPARQKADASLFLFVVAGDAEAEVGLAKRSRL